MSSSKQKPLLATHKTRLDHLEILLAFLPETLPNPVQSRYHFSDFTPTDDDINDMGLEGAVNHILEVRFGSRLRGLQLYERGKGLAEVVEVFRRYLAEFPKFILVSKWVDDILKAAEDAYCEAGIEVSSCNA